MTKRTMDIEAVLRWAYREELPKALGSAKGPADSIRSGWAGISSYAQLLAVIDYNRYGVLPDLTALSGPHDDAVRVAEAVAALARCTIAIPEAWNPLSDLGDLGPEGTMIVLRAIDWASAHASAAPLLVKHAILGGAPDWQGDIPERMVECGANGKPRWFRRVLVQIHEGDAVLGIAPEFIESEVDGYNQRRGRPYSNAYQKFYLEPDPYPVAISRAEYEIWYAGLSLLAAQLNGGLNTISVMPSPRAARPWEGGHDAFPRILESASNRKIPSISQNVTSLSEKPAANAA